jgi:hypothetical protein
MKRKAVVGIVLLALLVAGGMIYLLYSGTGGFRYRSSGVMNMSVESGNSVSKSFSFGMMKGQKVFRMKYDGHEDGRLVYSGKLDTGKLTVYYDDDGTKKELFTVEAGGPVETASVKLTEKGSVYIIVETDGKCEGGKLEFEIQ